MPTAMATHNLFYILIIKALKTTVFITDAICKVPLMVSLLVNNAYHVDAYVHWKLDKYKVIFSLRIREYGLTCTRGCAVHGKEDSFNNQERLTAEFMRSGVVWGAITTGSARPDIDTRRGCRIAEGWGYPQHRVPHYTNLDTAIEDCGGTNLE